MSRLIFYEPSGKKGGVSVRAFDHGMSYGGAVLPPTMNSLALVNDILRDAHDRTESCACSEGCASCTHNSTSSHLRFADMCVSGVVSPSCKEGNLVSSKAGALIVLKALLGLPIDVDLLQPQDGMVSDAFDTVVAATSVRVAEGVEVESA